MKPRISKEEIEEAKEEFNYINDCYKELIKEHIDIRNYKQLGEIDREKIELITYYEVHTRCFYNVRDNKDGTNQEITCLYRLETEKLPKLLKINKYKKGYKFLIEFKGEKYKSTMVSFTTFTKFVKTYENLIQALERKFIDKNYC